MIDDISQLGFARNRGKSVDLDFRWAIIWGLL